MEERLCKSLTLCLAVFARLTGIQEHDGPQGYYSFAEACLYRALYRAITSEEEADAEDETLGFDADSFYLDSEAEGPTEVEVCQLEVELREVAKKTATAEFWQRPWRWTEQPTEDEELDADSYDEGTRCEIVCGLVDDAIRLAAEGPVLVRLVIQEAS